MPELEQATLMIHDVGSQIRATCQVGLPDEDPDVVVGVFTKDRASLAARIGEIKNAVPPEDTTIWAGLADPLAEPAPGLVAQRFEQCMNKTVEEGSKLYAELSDNGLRDIMERLDRMPDGSRLRISTDCAFLPWEILYPAPFSVKMLKIGRAPQPDRQKLWGYRFVTSYNLLDTGQTSVQWGELRKAHRNGRPFVSVNLNSSIEQAFAGRTFRPIKYHKEFCTNRLAGESLGEVYDLPGDIYNQLYAPDGQATILYLYCHGSNSAPFAQVNDERLEIAEKEQIEPNDLRTAEGAYARAPIIFLNSCLSNEVSPLSFSSFHSAFRGRKAMGIIGTAIKMPATFAAAFGCKLIERYLEGTPLGVAIYALRRELIERGNPLGLFYSLQCPAELRAPEAGQPQAPTPQEATP